MLAKGDRVGRYVVDAAVGSHGGVDVYRGHDPQLDRAVAVKLLPGTNQRFHREPRATALLNHPNIVATLDVFDHDGRLCIVREWVDTSLEAVLAEKPSLGLEETLRVGRDVAAALVHAHARGVLHRDIKPANVLLTAMGSHKLVDFGSAGLLQQETAATATGQIAGTPLYMAPEQLTGDPQTAASDIFGLGMLLFRCLHGRVPQDDAGDFAVLALQAGRRAPGGC